MESDSKDKISIEIPNFSGPLEVLLDLAKTQKVNLTEISITKLVDQFLEYLRNTSNLNLETASEFLLMATWLAYLKSKLLLPEEDDDNFKASEAAEKLKLQLKKLELIRLLSDQMLKRKRIGVDIFYRGMKGGIKSINSPKYELSLYELLKTYAIFQTQKSFKTINIPKLPVFTTDQGIQFLKSKLNEIKEWEEILNFVPDHLKNNKMYRTGISGIFAASLELSREGVISLMQKKNFDKILIKKN